MRTSGRIVGERQRRSSRSSGCSARNRDLGLKRDLDAASPARRDANRRADWAHTGISLAEIGRIRAGDRYFGNDQRSRSAVCGLNSLRLPSSSGELVAEIDSREIKGHACLRRSSRQRHRKLASRSAVAKRSWWRSEPTETAEVQLDRTIRLPNSSIQQPDPLLLRNYPTPENQKRLYRRRRC